MRRPARRVARAARPLRLVRDGRDAGSAPAPRARPRARRGVRASPRRCSRASTAARLRLLGRRVPPPAACLDAGAGRGRFVAAAARRLRRRAASSPTARRGGRAARSHGVPFGRAGLEDASSGPVRSTRVTRLARARARRRTRRRGRPCRRLAAPRRGAARRRAQPRLAAGPDRRRPLVPPRRSRATARTSRRRGLRRAAAPAGLEPVRARHVLAEHNPFGMWQSLVNRATRRARPGSSALLKRDAPLRTPATRWSPLLAVPLLAARRAARARRRAGAAGRNDRRARGQAPESLLEQRPRLAAGERSSCRAPRAGGDGSRQGVGRLATTWAAGAAPDEHDHRQVDRAQVASAAPARSRGPP